MTLNFSNSTIIICFDFLAILVEKKCLGKLNLMLDLKLSNCLAS